MTTYAINPAQIPTLYALGDFITIYEREGLWTFVQPSVALCKTLESSLLARVWAHPKDAYLLVEFAKHEYMRGYDISKLIRTSFTRKMESEFVAWAQNHDNW